MSRLRKDLYRGARLMGDLEAASQGPVPYAKRRVRRRAYAGWNRILRRMLRSAGL